MGSEWGGTGTEGSQEQRGHRSSTAQAQARLSDVTWSRDQISKIYIHRQVHYLSYKVSPNLIHFYYLCVIVCMCTPGHVCATMGMQRSEGNFVGLALSYHFYVNSRDQTPVSRLAEQALCLLSHLASSQVSGLTT